MIDKTVLAPELLEQVEEEVKVLAKLKHINIVKFFEKFDSSTELWIVLELYV